MAKRIVDTLFREELIIKDVEPKVLAKDVEAVLMAELMVEDRINEEVRNMLREHEQQIDRGGYDYRRLFDLTKQKLIKEQDVII